jgi:hypothetical protein
VQLGDVAALHDTPNSGAPKPPTETETHRY